jgi:hypothetical protein
VINIHSNLKESIEGKNPEWLDDML